jgi:hypothetical protein
MPEPIFTLEGSDSGLRVLRGGQGGHLHNQISTRFRSALDVAASVGFWKRDY